VTAPPGSTTAKPILGAGQVGTREQIPWPAVGPGWFLVVSDSRRFNQNVASSGTQTLSLVDPQAGRYVVTSWPSAGTAGGMDALDLRAWSGDGRRALFGGLSPNVVELELATGTRRTIGIGSHGTVGYTSPTGANLVVSRPVEQNGSVTGYTVVRVDSNGRGAATLASSPDPTGITWLYTPDGSALYLSGMGGIGEVSNAGGALRSLPAVTMTDQPCRPVRWWDAASVVVNCSSAAGDRLWAVPTDGAPARALTPAPGGGDPVGYGYNDIVRVGASTFLQHLDGCGVVSVGELDKSGSPHPFAVPGSLGNDKLIGASGGNLAIASSADCAPTSWFGLVDPAAARTVKVIPDVAGVVGIVAAMPFPR
jgi:hypothetical protein